MTQTIEQLTARVRELEEENARLKAECDDIKQVQFPRKLDAVAAGWKKQLAAAQADNNRLRDALGAFAHRFPESEVARDALASPSDTSALDAYVAEKVKEVQRNASGFAELYLERGERIHHLTRQRDLAVEALEKQLADAKHCQHVMCNEVGIGFLDVVTLANSESTLSAIKESEGK